MFYSQDTNQQSVDFLGDTDSHLLTTNPAGFSVWKRGSAVPWSWEGPVRAVCVDIGNRSQFAVIIAAGMYRNCISCSYASGSFV